jgi:hypothetical protein
VRIRLSGLQLVSVGLDHGALVLDFVGLARRRRRRHPFGGPVFTVRVPAGTFFDASLLSHLDEWTVTGVPLSLRARRGRRDGRVHRLALDDGLHRLSMRLTWPAPAPASASASADATAVSGRTGRRRSAPGAAPAGATPPGSA